MSNIITVVGAVFASDDHVLAFRRKPGKSAGGKWEFPGGKVEPNESPQDALQRELKEELNVTVKVGDLIDRTSTPVGTNIIDLACYYVTSEVTPSQSSDHDLIRWQHLDKIHELDWAEPDLPTLANLLKLRS